MQDQDAEEFTKKVNDSGGNFELFVYDDAGHAFLTAESHRDSKRYILLCVQAPIVSLLSWLAVYLFCCMLHCLACLASE